MNVAELKALLRDAGIRPTKKLGQNYLIDGRVVERELEHARLSPQDTVLEVGPGLGALTIPLAERVKLVHAIEKDERAADALRPGLPDNVNLIVGDALKVPLPPFNKAVANLPFTISSPVTFRLLDEGFESAVLMYQKEFADRMVAQAGEDNYSRLSVAVHYRAECEVLETVPPSAFYPRPEVAGALVRLVARPPPFKVLDEEHFFTVVRILFTQRRKKIRAALLNGRKEFAASKEEMKAVVDSLPHSGERVEVLAPEELGEVSDALREAF